jgi:hypothetical protein
MAVGGEDESKNNNLSPKKNVFAKLIKILPGISVTGIDVSVCSL